MQVVTVALVWTSTLYPFQRLYVPAAWPVSVPPVMRTLQPLAGSSVIRPSIVDWLIWSNDVHVETLRFEQPPLDVHPTPAELSWLSALPWLSLVAAEAGQRCRR